MRETAIALMITAVVCAVAVAGPQAGPSAGAAGKSKVSTVGVLTEEQLGSLTDTLKGSKEGEQVVFFASFTQVPLSAKELKKAKAGDPIGYRIVADLEEERRTSGGRATSQRLNGSVRFYIMDESGQVLVNRTESLAKLCPT
jgi:hypothetical protein